VCEFDLQQEKWFQVRIWYVWIAFLCGIVLVTVGAVAGYFMCYHSLYFSAVGDVEKP
jgi:hypothetical protein